MNQGGANGRSAGFTIVETMIVLAVTGVMLISIIGLISGKQNKTEFQQAINDVVTRLQQSAREVSIGYYPGLAGRQCTAVGSISFGGSGSEQGANGGCVFLGKILQFSPTDAAHNKGNEEYGAYTLAGCQFKDCSTNPSTPIASSFEEAQPIAVQQVATNPITSNFPDATDWYTLANGLSTVSMSYTCDPSVDTCPGTSPNATRAFGLLQSLGTYSGCSGLCSGSQQAGLYGVKMPDPANYNDMNTVLTQVNAAGAVNLVPAQQVTICLRSGTTNQSGRITIGADTSSVSLKIFDGGGCGA